MTTDLLFQPFQLNGLQIPNRITVAPMSRASATLAGVPSNAMADYYERFARGGFGLIISEGLYTDQLFSQAYPHQPGIVTDAQINGWRRLNEIVNTHGSIFIAQLMHAGALSQHLTHTAAPSAVQPMGQKLKSYGGGDGAFPLPAAMSPEDIAHAVAGYVHAARNAMLAGFKGVEIHAANGYLPDQFLTPYTNLRTDQYGGTVPNRMRFIAEIIAAVRKEVPAGFIVGLRISEGKVNNFSYRWPGGADTARAVLTEVQKVSPDYVHVSAEGGSWATTGFYDSGESLTGMTKRIVDVPVIANGGLEDTAVAGRVLEEGHADFISLGKGALANPDWPHKVRSGQALLPFDRSMAVPFPPLN
ncbi:NADH:flavin oxidoreductase [Chitinophaga sp. 212800010-3]|uniref:NADH:flavin oxidoreductase n=1 Tax=unclassified Chitinophaga TaxID=2619133 RepID=UPI002DE82791|nr:NADH:flavin oxidoreductase [Chitinophaga sp. 212800010-3]